MASKPKLPITDQGRDVVDPTLDKWPNGGKKTCKLSQFEVRLLLKALRGRLTVNEHKDLHAVIDWLEQFK